MLVEGVEGNGKFVVTLVNPNGAREETIKEIITALDNLSSFSVAIFSSIRQRLDNQRQQVTDISNRINLASQQVEEVKGAQKLIRIISPAKYPIDETDNHAGITDGALSPLLKPLVATLSHGQPPVKAHFYQKRLTRPCKFEPPVEHPDDMLRIYQVNEPQLPHMTSADQMGLGKPPQLLDLVDSFLLFNTAENPYKHYEVIERNQQQPTRSFKRTEENQIATNKAILSTDTVNKAQDDFYYSPSTLQIPEIDLPECLPHLPGIVNDFDVSPLGMVASNTPSFFSFSSNTNTKSKSTALEVVNEIKSSVPADPELSVQHHQIVTSAVPIASIINSAVPPPPPPPPPAETVMDVPKPKVSSSTVGISRDSDDMRSSLMAAIRAVGGSGKATLRSAQERKYEAKKKRQEEKSSITTTETNEGGSLMDDLKNTLAMRRKGISGIQLGAKQSGGGGMMGDIMHKLASTIPVMEKPTTKDSRGFDEDDDDDSPEDTWDSD